MSDWNCITYKSATLENYACINSDAPLETLNRLDSIRQCEGRPAKYQASPFLVKRIIQEISTIKKWLSCSEQVVLHGINYNYGFLGLPRFSFESSLISLHEVRNKLELINEFSHPIKLDYRSHLNTMESSSRQRTIPVSTAIMREHLR